MQVFLEDIADLGEPPYWYESAEEFRADTKRLGQIVAESGDFSEVSEYARWICSHAAGAESVLAFANATPNFCWDMDRDSPSMPSSASPKRSATPLTSSSRNRRSVTIPRIPIPRTRRPPGIPAPGSPFPSPSRSWSTSSFSTMERPTPPSTAASLSASPALIAVRDALSRTRNSKRSSSVLTFVEPVAVPVRAA